MRKIFTLLVMLCAISGGAVAQKLVTTAEDGKYYTLECNSTDHSGFLSETPNGFNGQSAKPTYLKFEQADGGFYVKSALTGKYLNQGEIYDEANQKYKVAYSSESSTVWTIGKLSEDATDIYLTIGDTKLYLNNNYSGDEKLHIVNHGTITTNNACSLWEMREHEDGYKVIETIGENITNLSQLVDGGYVILKNVGKQKYIYEGTHDHKLYMGTAATVGAGHEYIWRVRKEGDKYAFMAVSGRYFSTPLDGNDVFTCGIDNSAKDEFSLNAHPEDGTKWRVQSVNNANIYWDAQNDRFVGWRGSNANSRYEIIPVDVKNLEHALADYITVDENIVKWVNIKNLRSSKYATYEGESTKMSLKSDKGLSKAFFYLTGTLGADMSTVKIYNYATANLCAETNSWTAAGTIWNIIASAGEGVHPGWAITKDTNLGGQGSGNAWNNEGGNGNAIATWNGNDHGSTWEFESANFNSLLSKLEGIKNTELLSAIEAAESAYTDGALTETPITLTKEMLYCNAPYTASQNGDHLGVGALVDSKDDTYLHTDYSGNESADTEDHYIRVDLGMNSEVKYYTFNYKTRHNNDGNNPRVIVVEGSYEEAGEYFEVATLTDLPITGKGAEYSSPVLGGTAYRYLRFKVTDTNNHDTNDGPHKFFSLASFGIKQVTVKEGAEVKTMLYSHLPNVIAAAKDYLASPILSSDGENETEDDILAEIHKLNVVVAGLEVQDYPFTLTTDVNHPVCYFIKSGRSKDWSDAYYWTFIDGKITTITPNQEYKKDVEAYWFFMENPLNGQLQLVPFIENTKPMGYTTVTDGADKITNNTSASGFVGTGFTIVTNNEDSWKEYPHALKPYGGNTYLSNHNGKSGKFMGFYNGFTDGGTRFKLEAAEKAPSSKLRDLRAILAPCIDVDESLVKNELGYYNVENYEIYKQMVAYGREVYNDATLEEEVYQYAVAYLDNGPASLLTINLPEAGKFYRFKHNYGGEVGELYVQAKASNASTKANAMLMSGDKDAVSIFYYTDDKLLSYSQGLYVKESGGTRGLQSVGADAGAAKFDRGTVIGKLGIFAGDSFHANTSGDVRFIDHCGDVHNSAHDFTVEEVTTLPVTVSSVGVATLYTPVALEIPEDVNVYTAVQEEENNVAYLKLQLVEADYIPANTGVILEANAGTYDFNVTDEEVSGFSPEENVLTGKCETSIMRTDVKVYTLQKPAEKDLGFYLFKGSKPITGFRSWLELPKDSQVQSFRFKFGTTTDIESLVTLQNAKAIYDLSGRRVENMDKGIYIVNGKKIVVK